MKKNKLFIISTLFLVLILPTAHAFIPGVPFIGWPGVFGPTFSPPAEPPVANEGNDNLISLDGNDNLATTDGNDNLATVGGNDNLVTIGGNDNLVTIDGNDNLVTTGGNVPPTNEGNVPPTDGGETGVTDVVPPSPIPPLPPTVGTPPPTPPPVIIKSFPTAFDLPNSIRVSKNTADNTVIHPNLASACFDTDNTVKVTFDSTNGATHKGTAYDLSLEANGQLLINNLRNDYTGQETISMTCKGSEEKRDSFVLSVENDAPILAPIGSQTVEEKQTLIFTVSASDQNLDDLTLTTTTLPEGASFTWNDNNDGTATGSFTWTPSIGQAGIYSVTITVTDEDEATASETVTITVTPKITIPTGSAPVIISVPGKTGTVGLEYKYDVDATDADNDEISYSIVTGPNGMIINPLSGLVKWTPLEKGTYVVTVVAEEVCSETFCKSDTQSYTITVKEEKENLDGQLPAGGSGLVFSSIRIHGGLYHEAGETIRVTAYVLNNAGNDLEDVWVTAFLPEEGVKRKLGPFKLDSKDRERNTFTIPISMTAKKGQQYMRFVAYDGNHRVIEHRPIVIE